MKKLMLLLGLLATAFARAGDLGYSPRIARWLTRDPIGEEGGLNLYAYFWGCWPDTTNSTIPEGNRLVDEVGPHCTFYDDDVFKQLKTLREEAIQQAKEICETKCCKNGVWVRFQFSPSDNFGVRILDWLKGNSSRNKPARLVGGGIWEGDAHVKCR